MGFQPHAELLDALMHWEWGAIMKMNINETASGECVSSRRDSSFPRIRNVYSQGLLMTLEWQIVKEQRWVYGKNIGVFWSDNLREY